jgi:hypothetical protein
LTLYDTPHSPLRWVTVTNAATGLNFWAWREEDFMRQCGNDFGVIPRSFHDQKETSLPHCGREH